MPTFSDGYITWVLQRVEQTTWYTPLSPIWLHSEHDNMPSRTEFPRCCPYISIADLTPQDFERLSGRAFVLICHDGASDTLIYYTIRFNQDRFSYATINESLTTISGYVDINYGITPNTRLIQTFGINGRLYSFTHLPGPPSFTIPIRQDVETEGYVLWENQQIGVRQTVPGGDMPSNNKTPKRKRVKKVVTPEDYDGDIHAYSIDRWARKIVKRDIAPNAVCFVHGETPCACPLLNPAEMGRRRQNYSSAPDPYRKTWPEFAMGLELEAVLPAGNGTALLSNLTFLASDGSLRPLESGHIPTDTGEIKVATWDKQAALHAAKTALLIRRVGGATNKSCGLHVHCDLRFAPKTRKNNEWGTIISESTHAKKVLKRWLQVQNFVFYKLFPQRRNNEYCIAVDNVLRESHYACLNKSAHNTLEFRASPGTTNFFHAYAWTEFVAWLHREKNDKPAPESVIALALGRRNVGAKLMANFCYDYLRKLLRAKMTVEEAIPRAVQDITAEILSGASRRKAMLKVRDNGLLDYMCGEETAEEVA